MPADREAAKEELRVLLEAEQARADRELRRIKFAWLVCGLSLAAALVPWLFLGGLAQFVLRDSGYTAVVLVPAWLALLGIVAATFAAVLFMMRTMRASLGNIVERDVRKNHGSPHRRP
ncbi:hypothetical protein [Paeniglutamicibacter kerguelensis]|uniref:Apolipoprotein N-acyltransferase n=1 Tax=Paeniglutamicibacter kerguelensis TaxID=254788 RepID=A0ABS4XDE3_9MICC|nr:hypothetical protein [Paeniglutamicibacter kerguelensis]MBP2386490.1 apolipoprotein N-acyltransferase [Paeniglutamicibacter kerguelensis]